MLSSEQARMILKSNVVDIHLNQSHQIKELVPIVLKME